MNALPRPAALFSALLLAALLVSACQSSNRAAKPDAVLDRAKAGDAAAQFEMGNRYDAPDNSSSAASVGVALYWYELAAAQGHRKAACHAGYVLLNGLAGETDHARAMRLLIPASEAGDAWASELIATSYLRGQGVDRNPEIAFAWHERAAAQGSVEALFRLGYACANGQGAPRDYARAVEWFRKGAAKGNSPSLACLGALTWAGRGVSRDYEEARRWFSAAIEAKGGNSWAPFMLGLMSENGHGAPRDLKTAGRWYQQAAAGGYYQARIRWALLTGATKSPVDMKYLIRGAERGNPLDQFVLGLACKQGLGVPVDPVEAIVWLELAGSSPGLDLVVARETAAALRAGLPFASLREADARIHALRDQLAKTGVNLF